MPVTSGIKQRWAPNKASSIFICRNLPVLKILPKAKITNVVDTNPIKIKLADLEIAIAAVFSSGAKVIISCEASVVGGGAEILDFFI